MAYKNIMNAREISLENPKSLVFEVSLKEQRTILWNRESFTAEEAVERNEPIEYFKKFSQQNKIAAYYSGKDVTSMVAQAAGKHICFRNIVADYQRKAARERIERHHRKIKEILKNQD